MMPHLKRRRHASRVRVPVNWGHRVSVCIAILCNGRKHIVSITDEKVTFGDGGFSADRASIKNSVIAANWWALYAGNDALHAPEILNRAAKTLEPVMDLTPEVVGAAVDDAYAVQLRRQIENEVLRKLGFTSETFLDDGRKKLSPAVYNQICARIERVSLSLAFLVCGFDSSTGVGHILAIDGESAPQNFDEVGFAAIGAGAEAALSSLCFQVSRQRLEPPYSNIARTAYCGCEAKFMAETASTVGRSAFITVTNRVDRPMYISEGGLEVIRRLWEAEGAPRLPQTAENVVGAALHFVKPDDTPPPESNGESG